MLLSGTPATGLAEGEHARRAGAELLVLLGDLRKLDDAAVPEQQRKGLNDRILGSLSVLPLLLRLADQEEGRGTRLESPLNEYRALLRQNTPGRLAERLAALSDRYPFRASGILPASATAARLTRAARVHAELCAGCHDTPSLQQERPPFNLFKQARRTPIREFAARMVVGIRGDRVTGLDNPFSDEELASLIAYYRAAAD